MKSHLRIDPATSILGTDHICVNHCEQIGNRMPLLSLDQIQVGMELHEDVLDRNGQPLVRAGTVLSEKDLRRFKMWGVNEAEIVGEDGDVEEIVSVTVDPVLLEQYKPEVRALFKHTNMEHPFIAQLFQECLVRYVKRKNGAAGGT